MPEKGRFEQDATHDLGELEFMSVMNLYLCKEEVTRRSPPRPSLPRHLSGSRAVVQRQQEEKACASSRPQSPDIHHCSDSGGSADPQSSPRCGEQASTCCDLGPSGGHGEIGAAMYSLLDAEADE